MCGKVKKIVAKANNPGENLSGCVCGFEIPNKGLKFK